MNADTIKALGTMGIGSILAIGLIFVMYKQMELEAERNTFMHDLMLR